MSGKEIHLVMFLTAFVWIFIGHDFQKQSNLMEQNKSFCSQFQR